MVLICFDYFRFYNPVWLSYTMRINNAIPLELKQTEPESDFLMAWQLCDCVLDSLAFLAAFVNFQ